MNTPGKGLKLQNCNVTHCQSPNGVVFFNSATQAYYCRSCCWAIMDACGDQATEIFRNFEANTQEFIELRKKDREKKYG